MNTSTLADKPLNYWEQSYLKSQYKTLETGTDDKFDAWLMSIEERWFKEVCACLQGNFPDWRG